MSVKSKLAIALAFLLVNLFNSSFASFTFVDDRFRGKYTTENLDAIIEEYELFDGWYWTTPAGTDQTFHGHPDAPGWTDTSVNLYHNDRFKAGSFGCRWGINSVMFTSPDRGGYGECFGFAQFIGYLLSGDINPQGHWNYYYSIEDAHGLCVGDILRVEYKRNGIPIRHSAVVYSVQGEEIQFLQVSGSVFNKISVGVGFSDGVVRNERDLANLSLLPYLRISRSPDNDAARSEENRP